MALNRCSGGKSGPYSWGQPGGSGYDQYISAVASYRTRNKSIKNELLSLAFRKSLVHNVLTRLRKPLYSPLPTNTVGWNSDGSTLCGAVGCLQKPGCYGRLSSRLRTRWNFQLGPRIRQRYRFNYSPGKPLNQWSVSSSGQRPRRRCYEGQKGNSSRTGSTTSIPCSQTTPRRHRTEHRQQKNQRKERSQTTSPIYAR